MLDTRPGASKPEPQSLILAQQGAAGPVEPLVPVESPEQTAPVEIPEPDVVEIPEPGVIDLPEPAEEQVSGRASKQSIPRRNSGTE